MSKLNLSFLKKINLVKVAEVVGTLKVAVNGAKAVNSTQEYKHKDKVDKTLSGASKALETVSVVLDVFKK